MTVSRQYALDHFDEVWDRAASGEEIVLEAPGKPQLKLVPAAPESREGSPDEAVNAMLQFMRSRPKLEGVTIRDLIEEGRRY